MARKLTLTLVAALAATMMLLLAEATVRTTVIIDEEEPSPNRKGSGEMCQERMQEQQNLWHCQMYMKDQVMGGRGRRGVLVNPTDEHLDDCCSQLEQMGSQCTCMGLQMSMDQMVKSMGQMAREESTMDRMVRVAEQLPGECQMSSPSSCHLRRPRAAAAAAWF